MKRGYSNPIVTYEEIVNALKAIIDCSLNDSYVDSFDILNVKYDNEKIEEYSDEAEKALYKAIKSLDKTIDAANKIIKTNLEKDLADIETNALTLKTSYYIGQEKRKLSAQDHFVEKLTGASLPIDILYEAPLHNDEEEEEKEEVVEKVEEVHEEPVAEDTNKVLSDFEQTAISNFPEYFKEEIAIANGEEEPLDVGDLFNTMELEPIIFDKYTSPEPLEPHEEPAFNDELKVTDLPEDDDLSLIDFNEYEFVPEDEPQKIEFEEEVKEKEDVEEPVVKPESTKEEVAEEDTKELVHEEPVKEDSKPKIGKDVDMEKVKLLKKALIKAKEKGDETLIKRLKKQLSRELGIDKEKE